MQMIKETSGLQTVYRLRDEALGEVLGEAVVSESAGEIRLHGIFVNPAHRGRGYGTTLMETVLSLGTDKLVTLCTGLGNIAFFKRFGFDVAEIGESLVSMEKRL